MGVMGAFPTCKNVPIATWIQHTNFGAWFGPAVDLELEGNGGLCPLFAPYDADECFADGDAGLIFPPAYTINLGVVTLCPNATAGSLGKICQTAVWGSNIDIQVHNTMPGHEPYSSCLCEYPHGLGSEWCVGRRFDLPAGQRSRACAGGLCCSSAYIGLLSALGPPSFTIRTQFRLCLDTIYYHRDALGASWTGEGHSRTGESEDYLLLIDPAAELPCCLR